MTRADVPIGILLAVAWLWVLWQSTRLPFGSEFAPGSGFAPVWLSLIGLLLSVIVALVAWRTRRGALPLPESGGHRGQARVAAALVGMAIMIGLVGPLGLMLALLAYLLFVSLGVERLSPLAGIGVSVGTVAFIEIVFSRLLGVPFPTGPLGF